MIFDWLFHVYGFKCKLFTGDDLCADAMTLRADEFSIGGVVFVEAGHALQFSRDAAEVKRGFFGDGVFGDDLPIKLDGVIYHAGKFAHDDVQVGDAFGVRLFGMVKGDF